MSREREKIVKEEVCPECGGSTIISDEDSGEVVCGRCGLVVREPALDMGPDWRAFTQSERQSRTRVGAPISHSVHNGLSTIISRINRDAHGKELPHEAKRRMLRLRKWQTRSMTHTSRDRNLVQAMSELNSLSDKMNLTLPIREEAAIIYRKALEKGLVRGRSISAIVAASLYAACRITQTQRRIDEIARHSTVDRKELSRHYRLILRELRFQMPVPSSQLTVSKIAAIAGIGEETQQTAIEILRKAEKIKATAGKDPIGLAAAALYIACALNNEKKTQKRIAEAAGVTDVTIRNRYKGLTKDLNIDIKEHIRPS